MNIKKNFAGARNMRAGCICMRGVAGTGWRWWLFHLFAHDNRLGNQAVRGQRLIVTVKKLAPRSAPPSSSQSSLNSHKYVDSPASRPIVSHEKKRECQDEITQNSRLTNNYKGLGKGLD